MNRYTSPNLNTSQVALLIAQLQSLVEKLPAGEIDTPCCRISVAEYTQEIMISVMPAKK